MQRVILSLNVNLGTNSASNGSFSFKNPFLSQLHETFVSSGVFLLFFGV